MNIFEILLSPEFIFILSLLIALSIYYIGKKIAPPFKPNKDKVSPYACGEYFPPEKVPMKIIFFKYAVLFLIFDIVALLIAFSMRIEFFQPYKMIFIGLVSSYILIAVFTLYVLMREIKL